MRASRERKIGCVQAWGTLIALTLLSSLAACNRQEAPSAATAPNDRIATAPDSGMQTPPVTPPSTAPVQGPEVAKASPDEALADRVKSTLTGAGLDVLAVDVASADGAITLYGTVDSPAVRDQAARVAASVSGVKSVANELVIVRGS